jgi:hypothetical protein
MTQTPFLNNNVSDFFKRYLKQLETTDEGKDLMNKLNRDPRVKELKQKLISNGNGAGALEIKDLAMWTLWAIEQFGKKKAFDHLENFLEVDTIEIMITLWVLGISVDSIIDLDDNFSIIPVNQMPDSSYKFTFSQRFFDLTPAQFLPVPEAAIVRKHMVPKVAGEDGPGNTYWELVRQLRSIALLINLIEDNYCVPYLSTSSPIPEVPLGVFGGSGGGARVYDIWGNETTRLEENNIDQLERLFKKFKKLSDHEQNRFRRILERFSRAKRGLQPENKILDLGISLEMALLEDTPPRQLALHFRLRGSWLLNTKPSERSILYNHLRDIYNYRCEVAHNGFLKTGSIKSVEENFSIYAKITSDILQKLILEGKPDWQKLILNIKD